MREPCVYAQADEQETSYEATPYDQPDRLSSQQAVSTPSSPASPRPADRGVTPSSSQASPSRADNPVLTDTANGYIRNNASSQLTAPIGLSNQFSELSPSSFAPTRDTAAYGPLPVTPYSPTGSFANALTPLTEIPDNTDQLDDYDDADGDEGELRRLRQHQKFSNTLVALNEPALPPAMSLDALLQRQYAMRSASSCLSAPRNLQLTDGKENIAAIEGCK